jgi:oligoendopeptidase F
LEAETMAVEVGTRKRSEVPAEETWDLSAIYRSRESWEADIEWVRSEVPKLAALKGRLGEGARVLLEALDRDEAIGDRLSRVYSYAGLKSDEDTADTTAQAAQDKATVLMVEVEAEAAFLSPEILGLPEGTIERYLSEEPGLEKYRHALENLARQRAHVLDSETERLLASAGELAIGPSNIFSMLNDADLRYGTILDEDGNEIPLTKANYLRFLENRNRDVRRSAFQQLHQAYRDHKNTLAASYAASVKTDVFFAKTRKYDSALEASLFPNNIPVSVYDSLVATVNQHLDLLHRYVALRKRVLGLDQLGVYDLYVPIVPEVDVRYGYEEGVSVVLDGVAPLGSDYVGTLGQGLDSRWVDIYENEGKRSGAYSWGVHGVHPFILMNWVGQMRDVFTLAHEVGHAMHSHYTSEAQPYVYGRYTLFVAEVASTVNEMLLTDDLRKKIDDPKLQLYLVNHALEDIRGTLFRQTKFAEFERWAHEQVEAGEALTPDSLSDQYAELCRRYYGPDVDVDDFVAIEWSRIPHFYRAFYVYQYATGISAAAALAKQILEEGEPARKRYREFLAGGSSKYSLDLLKDAGVDMTTPQPVEQAMQLFGDYLAELERLL